MTMYKERFLLLSCKVKEIGTKSEYFYQLTINLPIIMLLSRSNQGEIWPRVPAVRWQPDLVDHGPGHSGKGLYFTLTFCNFFLVGKNVDFAEELYKTRVFYSLKIEIMIL